MSLLCLIGQLTMDLCFFVIHILESVFKIEIKSYKSTITIGIPKMITSLKNQNARKCTFGWKFVHSLNNLLKI